MIHRQSSGISNYVWLGPLSLFSLKLSRRSAMNGDWKDKSNISSSCLHMIIQVAWGGQSESLDRTTLSDSHSPHHKLLPIFLFCWKLCAPRLGRRRTQRAGRDCESSPAPAPATAPTPAPDSNSTRAWKCCFYCQEEEAPNRPPTNKTPIKNSSNVFFMQ